MTNETKNLGTTNAALAYRIKARAEPYLTRIAAVVDRCAARDIDDTLVLAVNGAASVAPDYVTNSGDCGGIWWSVQVRRSRGAPSDTYATAGARKTLAWPAGPSVVDFAAGLSDALAALAAAAAFAEHRLADIERATDAERASWIAAAGGES